MDYSVVVPVFNEQEILHQLYGRLSGVLKNLGGSYEIVFVNDGSSDDSLKIIGQLNGKDPNVKCVNFSRNFGHQVAITAGIDFSSGNAVVIIDADLQDPPELIPKLVEKWKEGYEVVYAVREQRKGETFFKKLTAEIFYKLLLRISNVSMPMNVGDFRLIDRKVVDNLKKISETHRYVRGLISWIGYKQTGVLYKRDPRFAGVTKYPLIKMMRFALDGITSFSFMPLRIATFLGFIISFLSFLVGIYFIFVRIFTDMLIQGWFSLLVSILFLGGVQLITLGIIGEYIGRIYDETKKRPLYIVREATGFEKS